MQGGGELASFQETNEINSLKRLLKDLSGQNWIVNWTKSAELNWTNLNHDDESRSAMERITA